MSMVEVNVVIGAECSSSVLSTHMCSLIKLIDALHLLGRRCRVGLITHRTVSYWAAETCLYNKHGAHTLAMYVH